MRKINHIDVEKVRELLDYNAETGVITWRNNWKGGVKAGDVAGYKHHTGYLMMGFMGKYVQMHRIAWCHYYGEQPKECIDHINCDRTDNRVANLRQASYNDNNKNASIRKDNTSGYKGVSWDASKGKWVASVMHNKKTYRVGSFSDPEAAYEARCKLAASLHKEFVNHG